MATNLRKAPKTWSLFGDVKRRPSPYEVVTGKFHYHFRRDPVPFELDPDAPLNRWYLTHREGSPFQVDDWEQFRDPHKLTYKEYVSLQKVHETYVDGLIDQFEDSSAAEKLDEGWVSTLAELYVPLRFPLHILQMTGLYVGQMAPSSYITNCANFQAADELRRIQRIAYWTKVLGNAHGDRLAETATAREPFESGPAWQPLRKVLEEMLIAYDWGEAFTALNLAVKPALDTLVNWQFATLAAGNDDHLLGQMFTEFQHDSRRSRDWTQALTTYALERDPGLSKVLGGWLDVWEPKAHAAVVALAPLFETAPVPMAADDVVAEVERQHAELRSGCGV
ncbi:aromatic/alkene monooxygenase hydroxylase subunit beta [Nocardioides aquiterrae]|uniref:aromatic/alkene monooxygenase hydroxylase subunit beta n=1 Tax=Nocardioides aquiterrae TaxID=203799 RepID=UPI0031DE2307